jgi:hypothetical protein
LLAYIQLWQESSGRMGKIFTYASNAYAMDTTDQAAGARHAATVVFTDPMAQTGS